MTDSVVSWKNGMSFSGRANSGFSLDLGASAEVGGADDGFRPMELIAIGLAGCTAMDVISILQKKRQDVSGFEVQVHADRASDHPKVFTQAVIEYSVTGRGVQEEAVKRAIELSAARYCSVHAMLEKAFPMTLKYFVYEDQGEGKRALQISGEVSTHP